MAKPHSVQCIQMFQTQTEEHPVLQYLSNLTSSVSCNFIQHTYLKNCGYSGIVLWISKTILSKLGMFCS